MQTRQDKTTQNEPLNNEYKTFYLTSSLKLDNPTKIDKEALKKILAHARVEIRDNLTETYKFYASETPLPDPLYVLEFVDTVDVSDLSFGAIRTYIHKLRAEN